MSSLILGLGNPGKKYEKNRHNAGFLAIDELSRLRPLDFARGYGGQVLKFKENKKLKAMLLEIEFEGKKIILAKPTTFMNESGQTATALLKYYKVKSDQLIVVYDELDLPFGTLRVRSEGSAAGHNGVKSIIQYLGTDKFWRIRIGTQNVLAEKMPTERFVLQNFSAAELKALKTKILPEVAEEISSLLSS